MCRTIAVIFTVTIIIGCSYAFDFHNLYSSEYLEIAKDIISRFQNNELQTENEGCMEQLNLFLGDLNRTDDGLWAMQMIDASAKIPAGVFEQNLAWLGRFQECINIESLKTNVKGQYCLTSINITALLLEENEGIEVNNEHQFTGVKDFERKLNQYNGLKTSQIQLKTMPYMAICVPDKCTERDIANVFNSLLKSIPLQTTCQIKETVEEPLDLGAILTICFFGAFLILMTASTLYDFYTTDSKAHPLLLSFSVASNGRKLFTVSKNPGEFSCLHGIKCISMMWVIVGHTFSSILVAPVSNFLDMLSYAATTQSMVFVNAVHSVDTFFVMTGMLVVYTFMKAMNQKQKFNIIIFYLHRYIRLTPPIIPVMLASIYLTKYLGSGPFRPELETYIAKPCRNNWWSTLLYVQNYLDNGSCIGQTWYLDVDMELYLISPIFLLLLVKLPRVGLGLMFAATVGVMIAGYVITWQNELMAVFSLSGDITKYFKKYYIVPHTRGATWFIGGILGYVLAKIKCEKNLIHKKMPKWLIGVLWIIVLVAMPLCIFAGHEALTSTKYNPYSSALYNAFARPSWAICVAWVIFACSVGYGGIINQFLSLPIFRILSKLSYSIYLVHLTLLYIITLSVEEPIHYSLFNICYTFWGALAISLGVSVFWVLAFESPVIVAEKYFLEKGRTQSKNQKETYVVKRHSTENNVNGHKIENGMEHKTQEIP